MLKTVKITHKKFAIEGIINNSEEIEIKEASGIPVFPGFKRVFDIAPGQFLIKNKADGSYFTWVPVSDEIIENSFGRLNLDEDTFGREHFHEEVTPELEAIHDFIRMYGGFYMATFPASKGNKGKQEIAKFVPSADPWVNICYEDSSNKTDVVRESKKYADTFKDGIKFCIEYGELWDYACQSLIDREIATFWEVVKNSNHLGNYYNNEEGKLLKTGAKPEYMVGGLYGLAGCVWRWTQESFGTERTACRGGSFYDYSYNYPAFYRNISRTDDVYDSIGFGGVLYGSTDICYPSVMLDTGSISSFWTHFRGILP
ncbi:MAG: hypothetical protein PHD15_06235 [Clostridia bacterium]|nr:hypothetical protein [Clostridia bacterium]MDD4387328.1 hypothetical protein [Clostridia bacterium]